MKFALIEKALRDAANQEGAADTLSAIKKEGLFWRQSPPVLLPYQQRWLADQSPIKVCEKSRRVGLSWAEACDAVLDAASAKGRSVIYVSYNLDMTENFIQDCVFWARSFQLASFDVEEEVLQDGDRALLTYQIRFASGHKIKALSSNPNNIRSKQARVIIDEAAFCDDLPELLKAAKALKMWGGLIRVISSHNGEENDFNQLVKLIRQREQEFSLHSYPLQVALQDGLYERICLVQGLTATAESKAEWVRSLYADYGSAASEELDCQPTAKQGDLIYTHFDPMLNRCDDYPLPSDRLLIGMDFNVGKMAAIVHITRNRLPRAVDEFLNLQDTPAMIAAIKQRFPHHTQTRLITIYPDAAGNSRKSVNAQESDIALLRQAGFGIVVDGSNPPVKDRINAMNTAFCSPDGRRDYLVNTARCPGYKQALLKQVWKNGEPDKSGGWDHANDAGGYLIAKLLPVVKVQQHNSEAISTAGSNPIRSVLRDL
jgi:hypothetical protein